VTGPKPGDLVMLPVGSAQEIDAFPRSKWGIPEPDLPDDVAAVDGTYSGMIDLVVVPGVAFDARCNRLGHGRGYYGESHTRGMGGITRRG
jgi:5-formyltetrahydrofolate cyclo-ligase